MISFPIVDSHLRQHLSTIAGLGGWEPVGFGSDLDGGLGLEESPLEINTAAACIKLLQSYHLQCRKL